MVERDEGKEGRQDEKVQRRRSRIRKRKRRKRQ